MGVLFFLDDEELLVRLERLEARVHLLEERSVLRLDFVEGRVSGVEDGLSDLESGFEGWIRAIFVMVCGCILTALVSLL